MEEELKVSACKNKLCILTLGLNVIFCLWYKSCVIYLSDVFFPPNPNSMKVQNSSQAPLTHAKSSTPKVFLQSKTPSCSTLQGCG